MKGIHQAEKHYLWKGDNVGYHGLHIWLAKHKPRPISGLCEICNDKPYKELSNISKAYNNNKETYTRDFKNWFWSCHKCHMIHHDKSCNCENRPTKPRGRPRKLNPDDVATSAVRVTLETKQLLKDLKQKHNFQSIDAVLRFYLSDDAINSRPNFHTARELKDMTYQEPYNSQIKDASNRIMRSINKSGPHSYSTKPASHRPSWQRRNRKF